jgi:polar amino acid transport system substrate-binding protein
MRQRTIEKDCTHCYNHVFDKMQCLTGFIRSLFAIRVTTMRPLGSNPSIRAFVAAAGLLTAVGFMRVFGDDVVLAADEWCPFDCLSKATGQKGFMVEIADTVFTKAGHTVVFQIMKWEAAVTACREGKITGVIGALKGDAPDFVFPAEDQGQVSQGFFTLKNSTWGYVDTASLADIKLGCAAAYSYCPVIDRWIANNAKKKSRVLVCKSTEPIKDLIALLMNQTITAIIEEASVFQYHAKTMNLSSSFRIAGYGCPSQPGYIAFSPKLPESKHYAAILSKGMIELRSNGTLSKMLEKYGLP